MCRVDDGDYEWTVGDENPLGVSDSDAHCEDCGRVIPTAEPHTVFTAERWEEDYDPTVFVYSWPVSGGSKYAVGSPWFRFNYDPDDLTIDTFDALGFQVNEVNESDLVEREPEYHISCNHCRAADYWLREVCHQHVVLVTQMDLIEHSYDYTPEQLGPDFGTLVQLARQRWRSKLTGELIPTHVIRRLARDAADFALAGGLIHDR